ncbi:Zn-ribbon domain-containing OB-fold protein [Streptomyces gilvus]|uniref:Zn-ribbon domain-containing OB-fold protein n=1 Tax=Streptomyces gilvus TaxID=2920937 RepID=UPI001F0DA0B2|nr:zinc ribbon domain-containing protein [Streptomyces sp. CME 23]MCH5675618.1 zinc ribbon domain-containing protein [Streptomyces sp. CME 23]
MHPLSDAELVDRLPDILINHDNKAFYRGWLERRLLLNRCLQCDTWHHPPKPVCPECWSDAVVPTPVCGEGTVHLLIRLRQGPPADGVDYSTPHPVATVELAEQEGLRYTSTVIGDGAADVAIGDSVRLTWIERNGAPYPVFERSGASSASER